MLQHHAGRKKNRKDRAGPHLPAKESVQNKKQRAELAKAQDQCVPVRKGKQDLQPAEGEAERKHVLDIARGRFPRIRAGQQAVDHEIIVQIPVEIPFHTDETYEQERYGSSSRSTFEFISSRGRIH